MTEQTITLPDGRKLGYARYGAANGWPVLYFHGTPSSRLEVQLLNGYEMDVEQALLKLGLSLLAVDRPGAGLSSYHSNGTLLSFADDVNALLNVLTISRCSLLCWSGGGPYSLAMAWKYPSVVRDVFILCGFSRRINGTLLGQMNRNKWYFRAARYTPWLLETSLNAIRNQTAFHAPPQWFTGLPDADYQLIRSPVHFKAILDLTLKEACREGGRGAVREARLYFNDFGFALSDIRQPVHYWWGTEDKNVIRPHAEAVEQQIKNSVLHYKEKEGHLSLYVHYFKEVIQALSATNRV